MKFIRRGWKFHLKLGKRRKKKRVWRRPTGRDNKMREKRKGRPKIVSVGYKKKKDERGKINGKEIKEIANIKDLGEIKKGDYVIIKKMGKKKRNEIIKECDKKGVVILNRGKENEPKK